MNTTININLLGKGNIESMLKNATGAVHRFVSDAVSGNKQMAQSSVHAASALGDIGKSAHTAHSPLRSLGTEGQRAGTNISSGAGKAAHSLAEMGTTGGHAAATVHQGALHASHGLSAMGNEGGKAGEEITRSSETAKTALSKTGEAGRNAGRNISQGATTASHSVDNITKSADNAKAGLGELGDLLGMVMGGIGAASIGNMLWTGATERQFNKAYLSMKLGSEQAEVMSHKIEDIVAAVPGDDTFMNTLLGSAAARGAAIEDLQKLGFVAADYLIAAKKTGQTQIEAQQDLNAYIMTGTTGELERSRVLAGQVDKLEGKKTIHERILALDEALKANGYEGLSQMDIMVIKWETFKGKIQVAATELGSKVLPYLEKGVDFLLELDEKTGGWSTMIGLAAAGIAALALAMGPVVWSAKEVLGSFGGISDKLKGIGGKKKIDVECDVDDDCKSYCSDKDGIGGTSKGKSKSKSRFGIGDWFAPGTTGVKGFLGGMSLVPALSSTGTGTWAAMSGATAAGTVTGAALLGGAYGAGMNWLDTYMGKQPGGQAYSLSRLMMPVTYAGAPFQAGMGLLGDLWSGRAMKDPYGALKDYSQGMFIPKTLQKNLGIDKWFDATEGFGKSLFSGELFKGWNLGKTGGAGLGIAGMGAGVNVGGLLSGIKMPQIKWPSPGQILKEITEGITSHIPKLNWKLPSIPQFLKEIGEKINPLNWRIPNVGQLLNQTWQKIKNLIWNVPGVGSLLSQTWQKITQLIWQVPGLGSVLSLISSKIPSFHWPMGPGPSGPAGPGSHRRPPSGPIKNSIASTMANRSGVGQGYILGAMNRNFKGVDAFNSIADGMAANLGYQFYFGDQKSNQQVWDSGSCNCYDGAQFLMSEAGQRFGLGAGLANGVWDGTGIAHTWSVIGGRPFDMAARLIRGHWNPPSGPGGSFEQFMTDIGPGLEYMGYAGHQMDPVTALSDGGNCYDMTLGAMMAAENLWGLPTQMMWGTYDGNAHVWAKIDGKDYDPARRAREGTYNPPPQGPGPGSGSLVVEVGGIHIHGSISGVDDLDNLLNKAEKEAGEKIAARIFGHYGG